VVECQWTLARSHLFELPVDALRGERDYLLGVVPRSVWSYDPSHTWHEFAILECDSLMAALWIQYFPSQDSFTLGWLWPRSRTGESACVLRALDLSSRGVHIPLEARCRPGQGRRTCP
jgi:hypothetical protein